MVSTIHAITIDCTDAATLAKFWSQAVGAPTNPEPSTDFASIGSLSVTLLFVKVPENKITKNRVHLDLATPDLDAEATRLESLGARHIRTVTEGGHRWITLADPEGNEFDLFTQ